MQLKSVAKAMLATATLSLLAAQAPAFAEPAAVKQVAPEYPRGAERRKLEGTVDLIFDVTADGKVENVQVSNASVPGVFDKAAIKALSRWKFEEGDASQGMNITIDFRLQ